MSEKYNHWSLYNDADNVFWLTFDQKNSAVNSLNESTLREFDNIIDSISSNPLAKALIIRSGKKTGFIVGADISQFKGFDSAEEATILIRGGQEILNKLEQLPIPTIALIEGYCLGGGLELALACKYRIVENSSKTRLGLPEVKLGIHPGWGGTIRLPKLIGALQSMDVILTGKNLYPKVAKKMGIADEAVPKRLLEKAAMHYAQKPIPQKKGKLNFQSWTNLNFIRPLLAPLFYRQLNKKINQNHYPAPFKVIENWQKYGVTCPEAMKKEAESIGKLLVTDTSRNLVRVFFLQEQLKGLAKGKDFPMKHVHVIGAGVMGGDIAAWCALRGFRVSLQDQAPKLIGSAIKRAFELAQKQLKEKHLVQEVMDRLIPDTAGNNIKHADVIIEAITEKLEAKQTLFIMLEKMAKKEAILATNTSTIPIEEIGSVLQEPQRLVGIHFFNPVAKMPLVEIVHGEDTSNVVFQRALNFVRKIDKLPLPVKSSPGFLVNRILLPYMLEAVALLEEGIPGPVIDKAAVDFGMPMGPIELADTVGLDICLAALEKLATTGENVPSKLKEYVLRGELGRKTGKGFYEYKKGQVIKPPISDKGSLPQDIIDRLTMRLLNEAMACLREGIVENADLLDAGCIFGFGFPPFRGGPLTYARTQGKDQMVKILESLESRYGIRFAKDSGWQKAAVLET